MGASTSAVECNVISLGPALDFSPVDLSIDDWLPADITMLLVYRQLVECHDALTAGLEVFPHLTGRIDGWPPRILTNPGGEMRMEQMISEEAVAVEDFERFGFAELVERFVPTGGGGALFAARRVDFPRSGVSALCLRVSHMAVDGSGFGLFLAHATAAARGAVVPPVVHDRVAVLQPGGVCGEVPEGHVECPLEDAPFMVRPDALAAGEPVWFAVPAVAVGDRNDFAAWLCGETARMLPGIRRVAVWCNTRGSGGVPPTFTGNAGCYLHLPVSGDDAALAGGIRSLATRRGLERARRVHQEILRLRAGGRDVWWDGPHDDLIQLNLLSPATAVADFGSGRPGFALLLSRNASGLRIFPSVCGTRWVVEATLPPGVAEALVQACAVRGLAPQRWGGGGG